MALEIQNETIVGTINDIHSMNGIGLHDNLQEKLNGELPINRLELIYLINSWGRDKEFDTNDNIKIPKCEATQCYDLSKLDTSEITDMERLFRYSMFNGYISNWDVSNVTDMSYMFLGAEEFNQPINNWDVSNVTDMVRMFYEAIKFNQALNNWDVSSVTNMRYMFLGAYNFNQALNDWNVSNVTSISGMFEYANSFNQTLNSWNTSNVTDINYMFDEAREFNQALDNWGINTSGMVGDPTSFETKFNNGTPLSISTEGLTIETLNKTTIIENKINNNKTTLNELFKEKNIDPNSKVGLELLKVYNDTHDKLKLDLEDLKTQVVDIATNDFNSI